VQACMRRALTRAVGLSSSWRAAQSRVFTATGDREEALTLATADRLAHLFWQYSCSEKSYVCEKS
jgi:hypothetical protein